MTGDRAFDGQVTRRGVLALVGVSLAACAGGSRVAAGDAGADPLIDAFRRRTGLRDMSIALMRGEDRLLWRHYGAHDDRTVLPIASASKWLAGAVAMALVDAGKLQLDAPIGRYLSGLPETYAALRLDALLSYTAGLPSLTALTELRQPLSISLRRSAELAAATPLASLPGTRFDYGGPNLQFVGAAVEAVTGEHWQAAFDRLIGRPLGMSATRWGGLGQAPAHGAPVGNPRLQAGAWMTLSDYAAFLAMVAQDGRYGDRRVLSPAAVASMRTVMTRGVPKGFVPPGAAEGGAEYLIAHWCERPASGLCELESSPGFFGTYPWVDRTAGLQGIVFINDRLQRVGPDVRALRAGLTARYAGVQAKDRA